MHQAANLGDDDDYDGECDSVAADVARATQSHTLLLPSPSASVPITAASAATAAKSDHCVYYHLYTIHSHLVRREGERGTLNTCVELLSQAVSETKLNEAKLSSLKAAAAAATTKVDGLISTSSKPSSLAVSRRGRR